MTKGTSSFGRFRNAVHGRCRRCGKHAYHLQKNRCSSCGFGATAKLRAYAWNHKGPARRYKGKAHRTPVTARRP